MIGKITLYCGIPFILLLYIYKSIVERLAPIVVMMVDKQTVLLILRTSILTHMAVYPLDLTFFTVKTNQLAHVCSHYESVA